MCACRMRPWATTWASGTSWPRSKTSDTAHGRTKDLVALESETAGQWVDPQENGEMLWVLHVLSDLSYGFSVCLARLLTDSDEIGAMEQNQAKETKEWWYGTITRHTNQTQTNSRMGGAHKQAV